MRSKLLRMNNAKNYLLSSYLALAPERFKLSNVKYIDQLTSTVIKINFQSLIDHLLSMYNTTINDRLAFICGLGADYTYFELYEMIVSTDKQLNLKSLDFLKKQGLREFFYALKNNNDNVALKEGLLFDTLNQYRRELINIDEFYEWSQSVVTEERTSKKLVEILYYYGCEDSMNYEQKVAVDQKSRMVLDTSDVFSDSNENSISDLSTITSETLDILKFNAHSKKMIMGHKKIGFFFKKNQLLTLQEEDNTSLVLGAGATNFIYPLMYQSLYNKKGFVMFNFIPDNAYNIISDMASRFEREDDVHKFFYGTPEFDSINVNSLISHNKIVLVQFPNLAQNPKVVSDVLDKFSTLIADFKQLSDTSSPYNIFVNHPVYFTQDIELLEPLFESLRHLKNSGYNYFLFEKAIDDVKILDALLHHVKHSFLIKPTCQAFRSCLKMAPLSMRDLNSLGIEEFYYFEDGVIQQHKPFKAAIISVNLNRNFLKLNPYY